MFHLVVGSSALLGLMSFALPHTPPTATGAASARQIMGLDALVLLKDRSYLVFLIASTLICIPLAFYYQIASRVVEMVDFSSVGVIQSLQAALKAGDVIAATMSLGQVSEIFFMLVMPFFFARLGVKWMLAVGMAAWVLRYALFAVGAPEEVRWMVLVGVLLHGICYDFFFVTGQIYTDQKAPRHLRAQAQGLLVLFTLGLGMAIGAQAAGRIEAQCTPNQAVVLAGHQQELAKQIAAIKAGGQVPGGAFEPQSLEEMVALKDRLRREELRSLDWKKLWSIPAVFAAVIMVLFLGLFRDNGSRKGPATGGEDPHPLQK
jgi:nucleoside transporter